MKEPELAPPVQPKRSSTRSQQVQRAFIDLDLDDSWKIWNKCWKSYPRPFVTIVRAWKRERGLSYCRLFTQTALRNACTQSVLQFEVTDFTGVPSSGRFVWRLKNTHSHEHRDDLQSNRGRRGGAHVRTTEITPPGTSALHALRLNHIARTKNLVIA